MLWMIALFQTIGSPNLCLNPLQNLLQRGRRPCGARGAHGAPGHVRLAASMNPDAHVRCTSPPHSVPSPGAMLSSMAQNPGYLNDAACAVRGRHPQCTAGQAMAKQHLNDLKRTNSGASRSVGAGGARPMQPIRAAQA
mmetsp:Transcript_3279/g.6253  ORF Transcript_3279/g.6253 Transcript_3279/m.6253 type:complete len:138 (+) Transcript_3279:459-872(+)